MIQSGCSVAALCSCVLLFIGCTNNPYREDDTRESIRYSSIDEDPKSLDPSFAYDSLSLEIVSPIYETLLQYSYLKRPYQLEPALAEQMPERETYLYRGESPASEEEAALEEVERARPLGPETESRGERNLIQREAFRYRITIKKGLRFQDDACFEATGGKGREVKTDDFIYAFKRMADPTVTCPVRAILGEKIAGLNAFYFANKKRIQELKEEGKRPEADYGLPVAGLRRVDDTTMDVLLTEKYPQFLYWLAMPFTTPIPQEAVAYYDSSRFPGRPEFRDHPVGTGGYVLKDYQKGRRIQLERNPNFRLEQYPSEGDPGDSEAGLLEDAGRRLPLVDTWVFTTIKEAIPAWNLFRQGYLDTSGIPREFFDRVITREGGLSQQMQERGVRLYRSKQLTTYYFAFNLDDPVVGRNKKLRQAISSAIHTAEYIELYENGLGEVAQGPLPPGVFGYDPAYKNLYRQFDLEAARRLLAEAGYPGGIDSATGQPLQIRFDTAWNDSSGKQKIRWLVRQFESLNIKLEVIINDWNTQQQKADEGNFQFIGYGWLADYPDPENFLFLLHSDNRRPGVNLANYFNPEYDRLFDEMKGMSNEGDEGKQRSRIIHRMTRILEEDCPWVPNFHPESYSLVHCWCGPAKLHGPANNLLKYARVDPEVRARLRAEWNRPNYKTVWVAFGLLLALAFPAVWVVTRKTL